MGTAHSAVEKAWKLMEAHDLAALDEAFAPDMVFTYPGGLEARGIDEFRPFLGAYLTAFPDLRHEVVDYLEDGERIAVELRVTGTHTGTMRTPAGDIPPTGHTVVWESVDWIHTREGKVTSWHVYNDQVPFLTALGLMPGPAGA